MTHVLHSRNFWVPWLPQLVLLARECSITNMIARHVRISTPSERIRANIRMNKIAQENWLTVLADGPCLNWVGLTTYRGFFGLSGVIVWTYWLGRDWYGWNGIEATSHEKRNPRNIAHTRGAKVRTYRHYGSFICVRRRRTRHFLCFLWSFFFLTSKERLRILKNYKSNAMFRKT